MQNLHFFFEYQFVEKSFSAEMFTTWTSYKSLVFFEKMCSNCFSRSGAVWLKSGAVAAPASLVHVESLRRLLHHGVLNGPLLPRAGLQDQQVAEVNVGRHHFQAASGGSVDEGLVLKGKWEKGFKSTGECCVVIFNPCLPMDK